MTDRELAAHVQRLYGLDPADFTAQRNAIVKDLKKAKRASDAEKLKSLRKPSAAEHALNTVARESGKIATRWAKALTAATDAQAAAIGGGPGTAFREATAELRAATSALVEASLDTLGAGEAEAKRRQILSVIQWLSVGNGPELLVGGIVGSAFVETADDLFAGAPDPPPRTKKAAAKVPKGPSPAELAKKKRLEHAEAAVRAAKARLQKAEDELRSLES